MPNIFDNIFAKKVSGKLKEIGYLGNDKIPNAITKLIAYLDDEDPVARRAAAAALEQHWMSGDTTAIAALTKALGDPDAPVRANAALALGEFASRSPAAREADAAWKALIELIRRETDVAVMKNAVVGLAHMPDGTMAGQLADALRAKDKNTVSMAIDAINDLLPTQARLEMKKALRAIL